MGICHVCSEEVPKDEVHYICRKCGKRVHAGCSVSGPVTVPGHTVLYAGSCQLCFSQWYYEVAANKQ